MSETTTGGGIDAVRPPQAPHGAILSADQVAAETAGHHEVLTTFTDLTGQTTTLREGCCVKCGERWPCLAAQWVAQDGRWRALVGDLLAALAAAEGEGQANSVVAHWQGHAGVTWLDPLGPASQRVLAALRHAQAARDGGAG